MSRVFSVSQKRQIVYTVLTRFLQGDELLEALHIWERQYAVKPLFALNDYVAALTRFPGVAGQRKAVIRDLVSLSQKPDGLLSDPIDKLNNFRRENFSELESVVATERLDKMFEHFLVALETVLSTEDFLKLRLNLLVSLGETNLNATLKNRLRAWFDSDGGSKPFSIVCSSGEVRKIVNRIYVVMCEIFGPMRADEILELIFLWLERYQPQCVTAVRRFL
ncbi:MAG TPA: hypothetical protein VIC08_04025 [Cellvibrionaceae bacterium]